MARSTRDVSSDSRIFSGSTGTFEKQRFDVKFARKILRNISPMMKTQKIIIVGSGELAEIAYEYFTVDSEYEVVAFCAERQYLKDTELFGLPVVAFEDVHTLYAPSEHKAYVAVPYTQLNRVRTRLYKATKEKGYECVSYISSKAFVWRNVIVGENCFIFENNVVQYHCKLGNNIVLWSGNHIGHRTVIGDNCFISSHVVVSGFCTIGENCFFGVNSTLGDTVVIPRDTIVGSGAVIVKSLTETGKIYIGNPAKMLPGKDSYASMGVQDHERDLI